MDEILFLLYQSEGEISLDSIDKIFLEYINPDSYELSYTCLLIPRLPSCQLHGDLAERLPQWMQQICTSHKWRLEFLTVQCGLFSMGASGGAIHTDQSIYASDPPGDLRINSFRLREYPQ
jgi:hypothetical protein